MDYPENPISDERIYELATIIVCCLEGVPISQAEHILELAAHIIKAGSVVSVDPRLCVLGGKLEL